MSKVDEFLSSLTKEASEKVETPEPTTVVSEADAEAYLSKLANQNETIEASTTLAIAGEYLSKLAEESKDELIAECATGLFEHSQSLMTGLNKIAAENAAGAIVDMVETQDGLQKIASVLVNLAEKSENEEFHKIANSVTEVNNTLFDELSELASNDESVAAYLADFHKGK